ncbi:MAG TPA: protein kinase [Gemmatimonadales bacterium]|nr:protein kinase [Gemmatimonadales bacterium]
MALSAGTRLGPYEILALVSAGDAGDVYKANDTRTDRTVAIRTLPPHWVADAAARERFEQNALAVARLSHPHICTLHDIARERPLVGATSETVRLKADTTSDTSEALSSGEMPAAEGDAPQTGADAAPSPEVEELDFLVLEYVEGQTLAQRLEKGPLSLRQSVEVAIAIADALDKAHQRGIVHRNLMPSNVMLTADGVKLLEFGLARPPQVSSQDVSPTARTMPADATGVSTLQGTLEYMAPEQVEGKTGDTRSDIFALGAILHEMVTGAKAFEGKNQTLLIAAIVSLDLDPLSKLRPGTPPALDHVAKRCLEKDPESRWQTAHDLGVQLRWIAEGGAVLPSTGRNLDRLVQAGIAAAIVLAVVTSVSAFIYVRGANTPEPFQFRVPVYGINPSDIAISPDGETIAAIARPDPPETAALYVRAVRAPTFRRVAGTDDASQPFWSPDSKSVAFVAGGRLKRVEASGGPPENIAEASGMTGGTWGADGTILYGSSKGVFRVSAQGGGKPEAVTVIDKGETGHYWPSFLPDGRHFTYLAWSTESGGRAVFAGALGSQERKRLVSAESNASFASGYLVYHREATLFAQAFDPDRLEPTGDALHIADELAFNATNGRGSFDVSQNGVLLYYQGQGGPSGRGQTQTGAQFGWRDRGGGQLGVAGDPGQYGDFDLSPDAKFFAVTRQDSGAPGADIWVTEWQRGATTRLTLDPGDDINPVWSPDGQRIAFTTFRKGNADIYVKNANGVGPETPLVDTAANEFVEDWSKDGKYLAYKLGREAFEDIHVIPLTGDKPMPIPVVEGAFRKDEAQFSYDGKWIAYTSDESGAFQVYVIDFPGLKERRQVSTTGGGQPRWDDTGKRIFYRSPDGLIMEVALELGTTVVPSAPRVLFPAFLSAQSVAAERHQLSVTRDGNRFLVRYPNAGQGATGAGAFAGGRGPGGGVAFNYNPPGQTVGGSPAIGRGNAFSNTPALGLTVIRNWTALFQEAGQ